MTPERHCAVAYRTLPDMRASRFVVRHPELRRRVAASERVGKPAKKDLLLVIVEDSQDGADPVACRLRHLGASIEIVDERAQPDGGIARYRTRRGGIALRLGNRDERILHRGPGIDLLGADQEIESQRADAAEKYDQRILCGLG